MLQGSDACKIDGLAPCVWVEKMLERLHVTITCREGRLPHDTLVFFFAAGNKFPTGLQQCTCLFSAGWRDLLQLTLSGCMHGIIRTDYLFCGHLRSPHRFMTHNCAVATACGWQDFSSSMPREYSQGLRVLLLV